jgi:hypothetical protein
MVMFVQVFQGKVSDAAGVRDRLETWVRDLAPGAHGWLGSTAGVTDAGDLIALARFESEEAAQRNSDRPSSRHGGRRPPSCSPASRSSATAPTSTWTPPATPTEQGSSR